MKVTVTKFLNVRVGQPSVNAPCFNYLAPGSTIEVEENLLDGDDYEGNSKWYKGLDGSYYWSGGVKGNDSISTPKITNWQFDANKMSWGHKRYDIPTIWRDLNTMGKDVTIAVVDTGIDASNIDLIHTIHPLSKSLLGSNTSINDTDGHGTNMAGIIGASGTKNVYGVAPEIKLLIVRTSQDLRGVNPKTFAQALNYIVTIPEVDIISVSNSFFINDIDMQMAVQKCITAKKIIVSAIGNARDVIRLPNGPDKDTYPACYNGVLAVGAFDKNGQVCGFSNWNANLSFLAPGDYTVLTTGLNGAPAMGSGTSIATAFASGCLGLLLSYAKQNNIETEKCITAILETCDDIGPTGKDIQSGYGLMNFQKAAAKLKNA